MHYALIHMLINVSVVSRPELHAKLLIFQSNLTNFWDHLQSHTSRCLFRVAATGNITNNTKRIVSRVAAAVAQRSHMEIHLHVQHVTAQQQKPCNQATSTIL